MFTLGSLRDQSPRAVLRELIPTILPGIRSSRVFWACAATLIAALVLGGGTRGGFLSDTILELLAVPALLISLSSLADLLKERNHIERPAYWALLFCFAVAVIPLIQLVPLPPWIWGRLPGREAIESVFDLLGGQRPWMPLSVAPTATWLSFLSLLAPLAIFLGTIQLRLRERRRLTLIVIAVAVVSAFLGLVQFGQGPGSSLRFFAVTNINDAVGFFANRNHFAALLYTSLLFAAAWAIDFAFKNASWDNLKRFTPVTVVALTASFLVVIVLLAAEGMARSRAGIILSIVALAGIFALASTDRRNTGGLAGAGVGKLLFAAIGLALLLVVEFGLYRIANRFSDPLEGARTVFAHNTIRAALAFMPFGAGLGTFVPVYAMFERPVDTLANVYANHAHDDVLEWWLETGVVGIAMMAFFVFGLVTISLKIWRHPPDQASNLDCLLMRAATIVVGLLIAHSIVDYPLRTDAMMAVFALSCAMMIEPLSGQEAADLRLDDVHGAVRRKNQFREPSSKPPIRPIPSQGPPQPAFPTTQARKRWGEDVDWPEEWRDRTERSAAVGDASAVDTPSDSEE